MTDYFTNVDEVEFHLGYTFTPDQAEMVWTYLTTGQRPPAGCFVCSEGYIRRVTGEIDAMEEAFRSGEKAWIYEPEASVEMKNLGVQAGIAREALDEFVETVKKFDE